MFLWKSKILNYEDRPSKVKPSIILLHYTGMKTAEAALERLTDPESKVSAHHIVYEDGSSTNLVPEDKRAWHAGVAYWKHETDVNTVSIGIEVVNPGHEFGYRPFTDLQMWTILMLCRDIKTRYNIDHVLGHSDVAPERKQDPGELFDWEWLADHGIGLWPHPTEEEFEKAESIARTDFEIERSFIAFGYNPMAAYVDVITAFQRHYFPEVFEEGREGEVCVETVARLLSLIRQVREIEN